jgi:homoserine kinase type II
MVLSLTSAGPGLLRTSPRATDAAPRKCPTSDQYARVSPSQPDEKRPTAVGGYPSTHVGGCDCASRPGGPRANSVRGRWRYASCSAMAVFTEVSFSDAAALLASLGAGELQQLTGIAAGIENTNYFAETAQGRYVVTVFERLSRSELPFYLGLMLHLARRGLPVPRPLAADSGVLGHTLCGKPAAVTVRLPGATQLEPTAVQRERVAETLAALHQAGQDYPMQQPNPRGLAFWEESALWLAPLLSAGARALLDSELQFQLQLAASSAYASLPRGATHGDLFRDNVLFEADRLSGLLDFYFAATDTFLFDLAVCLNDWCAAADGRLLAERAAAFVSAYARVRRLSPLERELMPACLRAAALRFWITRLVDVHRPRDARLLRPHDPAQFQRILQRRVAEPWQP